MQYLPMHGDGALAHGSDGCAVSPSLMEVPLLGNGCILAQLAHSLCQ